MPARPTVSSKLGSSSDRRRGRPIPVPSLSAAMADLARTHSGLFYSDGAGVLQERSRR